MRGRRPIHAEDIPRWYVEMTRLVLKNCSEPGRFIIELDIPSADEEPREVLIYRRVKLNHSLVENRRRTRTVDSRSKEHLGSSKKHRPALTSGDEYRE